MASRQPLKGVNLGGWLVLEPWITPSLFNDIDAGDEYSYCQNATKAQIRRLQKHHAQFITEADIIWLAAQGIQALRIPVGYWIFGDQQPYIGSIKKLDNVFTWSERHGLKILIDLHGVAGSQNGKNHSGQAGDSLWHTNTEYQQQTLDVLLRLARRYSTRPALLGVSLLNEPSDEIDVDYLEVFYNTAYQALRLVLPKKAWIVFSDAFQPDVWAPRMARGSYPGLHVDHHHYQVFAPIDKRLSAGLQVLRARWLLPFKIRRMSRAHPTIIGEWCTALRDEAFEHNDLDRRRQRTRKFGAAQQAAFAKADAWFYWTYIIESGGAWSFRDCIERDALRVD